MFKFMYEKAEDIPKGQEEHYKEVNGKFILDVEGVVPLERANELTAKVNEFRKTNTDLLAKVKEFDGKKILTEEEHKELLEAKEKLEKGHKPEEIETLVEKRVDKMRKTHQSELASAKALAEEATKKHTSVFRELETSRVQAALGQIVNDVAAPAKGAMQDIIARATGTFRLSEEGQIVARDGNDDDIMGADGQPLTMKEFVTDLTKNAPYLFERSTGTGAKGTGERKSSSATRTLSRSDASGLGHSLEAIAKGEVTVDMDG